MNKLYKFSRELSLISNNEIVAFIQIVLNNASERFWTMPASSTNKYHPDSSNTTGGLVVHTKQVFYIAKTILDARADILLTNRDVVLAACLLHDVYKYDSGSSQYTIKNHARDGVRWITSLKDVDEFFVTYKSVPAWYEEILNCIMSHHGRFTKEYNGFLNEAQTIVHLADYIASRRWCYFDYSKIK